MTAARTHERDAAQHWATKLDRSGGGCVRVRSPFATKANTDTVYAPRPIIERLDLIPSEPVASVLDLVAHFTASENAVWPLVETARPSGAEVVEEGDQKPPLEAGFAGRGPAVLRTLAVYATITRQALEDRDYLESLLIHLTNDAIQREAWAEVLRAAEASTDIPTINGTVRDAEEHVQQQDFFPNAAALNPADWKALEGTLGQRAPTTRLGNDGPYLPMYGPLLVIPTPQQPQGEALIGDFSGLGLISQPEVVFSRTDSHLDDFVNNRTRIRGDLRALGIVCAPARLVKVTVEGES